MKNKTYYIVETILKILHCRNNSKIKYQTRRKRCDWYSKTHKHV